MKLTNWLGVFVLAASTVLVTGCEPAKETTDDAATTVPEGSSGTGGGVDAPADDMGEQTSAPAHDASTEDTTDESASKE